MKIKYSKPNNFFDFIYDSYIISLNREKILKAKKYSFYSTFKKYIGTCIGYMLLFVLGYFFYMETGTIFAKIILEVSLFAFFVILLFLISFIRFYFSSKKIDLSGFISIDKEGIIDEDDEMNAKYNWSSISYIIIGKYSFNIFFKSKNIYLRMPIDIKEDLLKEIREFSNVKIIDLTKD